MDIVSPDDALEVDDILTESEAALSPSRAKYGDVLATYKLIGAGGVVKLPKKQVR